MIFEGLLPYVIDHHSPITSNTTQALHSDFDETLYTCKAIRSNRHFFLYRRRRNFKDETWPSHVGGGFRK